MLFLHLFFLAFLALSLGTPAFAFQLEKSATEMTQTKARKAPDPGEVEGPRKLPPTPGFSLVRSADNFVSDSPIGRDGSQSVLSLTREEQALARAEEKGLEAFADPEDEFDFFFDDPTPSAATPKTLADSEPGSETNFESVTTLPEHSVTEDDIFDDLLMD